MSCSWDCHACIWNTLQTRPTPIPPIRQRGPPGRGPRRQLGAAPVDGGMETGAVHLGGTVPLGSGAMPPRMVATGKADPPK